MEHWMNTSALQIRVVPFKAKTTISLHHEKLLDSKQREEMKKYCGEVIEKMANGIFKGKQQTAEMVLPNAELTISIRLTNSLKTVVIT